MADLRKQTGFEILSNNSEMVRLLADNTNNPPTSNLFELNMKHDLSSAGLAALVAKTNKKKREKGCTRSRYDITQGCVA